MPLLTPIFFIVLAVKDSGAAVSPVVTLSPNWNNVYSGERVTMSCRLGSAEEKNPTYSYTWYKDDRIMSEKSQSIIVSDGGVYKCSVQSGIYSNPVRLRVIPEADAARPVVTLSPNWNNVLYGDKVTLSCSSELAEDRKYNVYDYTWHKNNQRIFNGISREITAGEESSGVYECSVKNGVRSVPVQLDVNTQGVLILQTPPDIVEGDSLSLRCHSKYEGNVPSYYLKDTWLQLTNNILYIHNVTTAQTGMYKCGKHIKLWNNEWKTAEAYLSVQDLFTTPKVKSDLNSLQEDNDMTLRCDTRINPIRASTELQFAFYKDGRTVQGFDVSDAYRVPSAHLEDSGNYTCEVRTASGTVRKMSDGFYIQIQRAAVTPVVTLFPNWNHLYKGDSVTLSCNMGSVEVKGYWYKGEEIMNLGKQYKIIVKVAATEIYKCSSDKTTYSHPVRLSVISNGKLDRPVVTLSPPWGTVFENEMITLACNTAKTYQNYGWIKDETRISRQSNQKLQIRSTNIKDSGHYQCGYWNDRSASVRVEVIQNAHLILQAPLDVIEGDSFDLRCHSLPRYKDEVETFFYKDNENLVSINNILHIPNVNTTMSGMYKCKKKFDFVIPNSRWIWAKTYISVQDLFTTPKIKSDLSSVREGNDVTLTCDTRRNPLRENTKLQFAFYKDGRTVREFDVSDTYKVQSAQLEDSGNYNCDVRTASDTVKKSSKSETVQIQELFTTPVIQADTKSIREGDDMTVRCDTKLDPVRSATRLQFAFYRDGRSVREFDVSDTYRVRSVKLEDSGNYTCDVRTASDTERKNSNALLVQIQELFTSPQIRVAQSVPVEEGKQVTLECVTVPNGRPSLQYVFFKDSERLQSDNMKNRYVIGRAEEKHTGNYRCSVQSQDGSVRKESSYVHLLVQHPILGVNITVDEGDRNFVYGKSLTLNCSIEKGSSPSFLWFHNETVVDRDSDLYRLGGNGTILYIESLQSHHAGTYRCNVSNKISPVTGIFQINQILEDPPHGGGMVWAVLGVSALVLLVVIFVLVIYRRKSPSSVCPPNRHQNHPNSESGPDEGIPGDDGNGPGDAHNDEHLYSNISPRQDEDDICYAYIEIKEIKASKGPTGEKGEPCVVYSTLQPVPRGRRATPETGDYENLDAELR